MRIQLPFLSILIAVGSLSILQSVSAKDFHCAPEAAGTGDGSTRENAMAMGSINDTFNDVMKPGDRMLLGSGTYEGLTLHLKQGGVPDQPKTLMGVDTGSGLPVIKGTWSIDQPTKGDKAIRVDGGASHISFKDFRIESFVFGVVVTEAEETKTTSQLKFSNIDMGQLRHGFYVEDCTDMTLEDCDLIGYSKHGFRFNGGCKRVRLTRCVADCSAGDAEWEKKTELFPFGFIVNQSDREQSDFVFEDCVAKNNMMPLQKTKYKNGDGFVVESSTSNVEFIRCRAIRNQDGGYDLKVKDVKMQDCVALDNSRGFRVWDTGSLSNCIVGRGGTGIWGNGGRLTVERSTLFSLTNTAVLTDDRSHDAIVLKNCIIASSKVASRKTSKGRTVLEDTLISDMEGATAEVKFVEPTPEWEGLSNGMDSLSHPEFGYQYPGKD